jgi:hypothetical protein
MKQTTFASLAWNAKGRTTRRERFLAEMNAVVPWARLLALIEPHYPKAGRPGRPPMPLERMLRIYFMQQWFNLSDPQAEDALYDIEPMRRFAGVELAEDTIPDETTILQFRHLLERHQLTEKVFAEVRCLLEEKRLLLKSGTIVDATIINAPSSTKNETKARDPEMRQGKKNKREWVFGMKVHVGASKQGLVHSLGHRPGERGGHHQAGRIAAWGRRRALRGPGVLERRPSAAMSTCGYPLSRQPPGGVAASSAHGVPTHHQSGALALPGTRRARLPCG